MKILYISDSAVPSSSPNSVHVMKMCQAFSENGHSVTLFAKNTTACLKNIENVFQFYSVKENFECNVFPTRSFRGSGVFYNLSLIWRLANVKHDLLYTRSITAAFFLLLTGRVVVFEVHEPFAEKGFRLRAMFNFIVKHRRLANLVVISGALKKYVVSRYGLVADRIFVAHDGADPFPTSFPILSPSTFKVGYVGSLYPGKGMEIILPLAQTCNEIEFHIVGGNQKQIEKFVNEAREKELKNLIFHGFKSQMELPGYIASFDVVLAPYKGDVRVSEKKGANNLALWMSPLKIFEYMAAAKAIVASDLPVIREILNDGETALLCDPEKLGEWVHAVRRLSEDLELRERLAYSARSLFFERYTWLMRSREILQVVSEGNIR